MRRALTALSVFALIASAIALYAIKYDTARLHADVANLSELVTARETEIAVMRADKANLLRPGRIESLAKKHTTLRPADPKQFGRVADLPWKDDAPSRGAEAVPQAVGQ